MAYSSRAAATTTFSRQASGYNALITNNHANGFGGGFAACPTGKTAITDTNGIAIFGNSDGKPDGSGYNRSGGSNGKSEDWDFNKEDDKGGEITEAFIKAGHKDLFLIHDSANSETKPYIAAVTGQMLGGGAANWSGTIDKTPTSIGKYEGAQAKYMIGLKSEPIKVDMDAATAAASLFITGNRSNIHGGGIMTNGDVVAGSTTRVSVYPKMKLSGTKELKSCNLKKNEFEFELLKQGSNLQAPSFNDKGVLQPNGCRVVDTAQNETNGSFTFDLGEVYADTNLVYYLVEKPGAEKDITYSKTIYKIEPTVTEDTSKSHDVLDIHYTYYKVDSVKITKTENGKASESTVHPTTNEDVVSIRLTNDATFTNVYNSKGSWTPKATKVVEGGEMKAFTFELANEDDLNFTNPETVTINPDPANAKTDKNGNATSTVNFKPKNYELKDLENGSKTFTYYVREKGESSTYPHYKFDQSVYRFKAVATDDTKGGIDCAVTYRKGTVDSDGNWKADVGAEEQNLTDDSTPTFTNTYSTSLPLSGMSGVTLTYLAGAAVLCAAAAWMHIRRKANAKGGERRE
ncbi:FctA domain-containing protein [Collinsella aerofaciens]|uniref:Spy0128 family protein n=1 Tax=Collinsella aerofaciens TaxID=74426 RepID=UPI00232F2F32|nr:FctA domain-containing protein [Collinsella aerofaciens]MDB1906595.1 FctA domain-containing protein [Collinsella aerofaciens]